MKKVIIILCSMLLCFLNVSATETDEAKACEALSKDEQVCSINEDGECECVEISVNPTKLDGQEGAD